MSRIKKGSVVRISLSIAKIRCGGCVASVEKAVLSVDPAATLTADIPAR